LPEAVYTHTPVMLAEVLEHLAPRPGGVYVDATVGLGGHAAALLRAATGTRLVGIDRDQEALERARERLKEFGARAVLVHARMIEMGRVIADEAGGAVDGVLMDLGVSSLQLDAPSRGFSFRHEGPLDMRMDRSRGHSAADLVNALPEAELADLIYRLGEERRSRAVARAVVRRRAERPFQTTSDLADVVRRAVGPSGKLDPATRTFQALRIAANEELDELRGALDAALAALRPGGRLVALSYHSLEDRIVKQTLAAAAGRPVAGQPPRDEAPRVRLLTKKPLVPSPEEIAGNARARSAKLRAAERLADTVN
jgi:16S rRNA (cytosine1402-N4)-methyltransferase